MLDPWWLKVKRAQKHMVDIKEAARVYARTHPYEFVRVRQRNEQREIWYRMRFTQQPDPMVALMLGDFIHNLRASLDYMVAACSPKERQNSASFPIQPVDIWATDKDGEFVSKDTDARKAFTTAVAGLSDDARALVVRAQPYNFADRMQLNALGILSRLDNADKHRRLITIGGGVYNLTTTEVSGQRVRFGVSAISADRFAREGTIIHVPTPARVPPSEVDVKFTGTAKILVKVTRVGGNEPDFNFYLSDTLLKTLRGVKVVLWAMQRHVRR